MRKFENKRELNNFKKVGNNILNKYFTTGTISVYWNGSQYTSGVYYIKFSDGFETQIRKIILLK